MDNSQNEDAKYFKRMLETYSGVEEFHTVSEDESRYKYQIYFSDGTDNQGVDDVLSRFSHRVDKYYGLDGDTESIVTVYDDASNIEEVVASESDLNSRIVVIDFDT